MMKVYQPLCPDITFRLAAELSPDESEESAISSPSLSTSEEEEEARSFGNASLGSVPPATSTVSSKNAKEVNNQGQLTSTSTTSTAALPTNQPRTENVASSRNRELNSNQTTEFSTTTAQPTSLPTAITTSRSFAHSTTATLAHGTKRRADDSVICSPNHLPGLPEPRSCRHPEIVEGRGSVSDEDSDSVEDVSISHNVPIHPPSSSPSPLNSSSSSPAPRGRGVGADEERGGASGMTSDCAALGKMPGLHFYSHRRSTKYQGPYTLACDVTPSPMQEQVTLASTITGAGNGVRGHVTAGATTTPSPTSVPSASSSSGSSNVSQLKVPRRPRKLPEIPRKHQGLATASSSHVRSIFDEIQEALIKEAGGHVFQSSPSSSTSSSSQPNAAQQYPYIHKHVAHLFDKKRLLIGYASSGPAPSAGRSREASFSSQDFSTSRSRHISTSSVASEVGAAASVLTADNDEEEDLGETENGGVSSSSSYQTPRHHPHHRPLLSPSPSSSALPPLSSSPASHSSSSATTGQVCQMQKRRRNPSEGDETHRSRSRTSSLLCGPYQDMEVTHRGMHRFIPRHADELHIGIGDPIHVIREYDDLWCEGVNLRSGERGIFPAMYANDLTFLEDSDGDEEHWKFTMRFLGAVEVSSSSGDFALCQAINKVAQQGRSKPACLCTLEINQYGIRMIDKSKEGHQSQKFTNFFALKNISFCGTHPNNNRYFAFITKHPREMRFACHVFHSDRSTHRARDALGNAFKRFYQEYMAFTHPTEDIWIE